MADPTVAEMKAAFDKHVLCEFHRDLDGTIATMDAEPWYEVFPFSFRLDGASAVREWYRRMFDIVIPRIIDQTKVEIRALSFGDSHMVAEFRTEMRLPDGRIGTCHSLSVIVITPAGSVAGERFYMDQGYASIFELALGDDFKKMPGYRPLLIEPLGSGPRQPIIQSTRST